MAKIIASAAVVGLVGGLGVHGVSYVRSKDWMQSSATDSAKSDYSETDASAIQMSTTNTDAGVTANSGVSQIVDNLMPAIVAITSTIQEVSYNMFGQPQVQEASGAGSGIIVGENDKRDELYIATNNHVIANASTIVVQFADDTTATGTVKGSDSSSDLAVVVVDMSDLSLDTISKIKVATLGNSEDVKVGEMVVAIGNALGYGQSVTVGCVSALNREITVEDKKLTLLQTDAAINPGNSGGALLNARGEVIGINSVKYVETEVEGIGYAIPITTAVPIINELMNREIISQGEQAYLGIGGEDVTEEYSEALGLPVGVYINQVEAGSAADKAGFHIGDVITGIGGRIITSVEQLKESLSYTRAGTTVTIKYETRENGKYVEKSVEVKLTSR